MLQDYKRSSEIGEKWLDILATKINSRYIVVSTILSDDTRNTRNKEKKKVYSKSFRKVSVVSNIYDLEQKLNVWSGSITKEMSEEIEYKESSINKFLTVTKALTSDGNSEDQVYPYPPAPATNEIVIRIFKGFGQNMPEEK
jgi:hypothetical protein